MNPARGRSAGRRERDRVAHLGVGEFLDSGDHESDLPRAQGVASGRLRREDSDLLTFVRGTSGHEQQFVSRLQYPVDDPHQHDHPDVVIEPGIDDQSLQRRIPVTLRRTDAFHDRLQDILDALAGLGARANGVLGRDADHVLDLADRQFGVGRGKVYLVQHRDHVDALLDRRVTVRHRLGLDALRNVHYQERALACGERTGDLIRKIDVSRRVDQIEQVRKSVARPIMQGRGLSLDGDAPLPFQLHGIQHLLGHLAIGQPATTLDKAIRERRFSVIDVGDNRKITYVLHQKKGARGTLSNIKTVEF